MCNRARSEAEPADGERVVVLLDDEVDLSTSARLERLLTDLAAPQGPLVVDFSDVEFCDSTVLRFLARLQSVVPPSDVELRSLSPQVVRLLELTGFTDVYEVPAS